MAEYESQDYWLPEREDVPSGYEYLSDVMSNFDHEIDKEVAEKLKEGNYFADYPAREFYALIWWDAEASIYKAKVMRYLSHAGTAASPTLRGIMELLSDEYGWG